MKKLMVALTAVALGACAWAEEAATPTLTGKVEFKNVTAGPWELGANWAYSGSDATTALNIVGEEGSRVLEIKTGTAALTRNVWSDGNAGAIGYGIYIDTTINFQNQALDEVPVATNDEKLAIFVLDTTEIEGAPAGTNVYVLAGYGESGKALYRLAGFDDKIISGGAYRVVVKSYANVIAGGKRTGFLVYISNGAEATFAPCKVDSDGVFKLNADGSVNWTSVATQTDYLGLTDTFKTTAAVARWVNPAGDSACLFLSLPTSNLKQGNLSAVDFVGNAQIASVEVTATNPGFPADLYTMTVESTGATVELVSEGVTLAGGVLTATADGVQVVLKVTPEAGKPLVTATGAQKNADGNWEFTFANGGKVIFTASPVAAYVGETPYPTIEAAIEKANANGGTLKLAQDTTWPADNSDLTAKNLTLDLAGHKLTLGTEMTVLTVAVTGNLTITDSVGGGNIVGAGMVGNAGTLVIEKGIFDVMVVSTGTAIINGGSFLKSCNSTEGETPAFALAASVAQGLEVVSEGNYWKVQAAVEPETPTVEPGGAAVEVDAGTADDAAAKVTLQATSPDESVVDNDTYRTYFTKQVKPKTDAEGAVVEGQFLVTAVLTDAIVQAADVTAEVAADLGKVAAGTADSANVTKAKPGLYYSVKYTDNVANIAGATEGDRVMARTSTVAIPMPKVENSNQMFYQVQVNTAPKAQ